MINVPIGQLYLQAMSKINNDKVEIRELSNEMHKDYIPNLKKAADKGLKLYDGDFSEEYLSKIAFYNLSHYYTHSYKLRLYYLQKL